MKTPAGRLVHVRTIRPGYFHFSCSNLELIVELRGDGRAYLHYSTQDSEITPVFKNWKEAEKTVFELFDQAKISQQKQQKHKHRV